MGEGVSVVSIVGDATPDSAVAVGDGVWAAGKVVAVGVEVSSRAWVAVGVTVSSGVAVAVANKVAVGVADGGGVGVRVAVGNGPGVDVAVAGTDVAVAAGVGEGVAVGASIVIVSARITPSPRKCPDPVTKAPITGVPEIEAWPTSTVLPPTFHRLPSMANSMPSIETEGNDCTSMRSAYFVTLSSPTWPSTDTSWPTAKGPPTICVDPVMTNSMPPTLIRPPLRDSMTPLAVTG